MDEGTKKPLDDELKLRRIVAVNSREFRKIHKLTSTEVSERSGISRHTISAIENMETDFSLSTVAKLAQAEEEPLERLLSAGATPHTYFTLQPRQAMQLMSDIAASYASKEEEELVQSGYRKENILLQRKSRGKKR